MPKVLLINTNTMQPPVAPIGLDYVASALEASAIEVALLDLAFVEPANVEEELVRAVTDSAPDVIGLTVRNTDDCCSATRDFMIPRIARWIAHLRRHGEVPIVVGGVGFSVVPAEAFDMLGADYGIAGDGEAVFPRLVGDLLAGRDTHDIPGLLWFDPNGELRCNPAAPADAERWPLPSRAHVDNARYVSEGGMVGIETKRGCPGQCVYCADPVAKGARQRLRPPGVVVEEIQNLLAQGAGVYHICDSEFNLPGDHGRTVCEAICKAGLGDRIRWYAYCSPVPFDEPTARLYRNAGCRGIDFGCDSGCDEMLQRLGRNHERDDIAAAVSATKAAGMSCMIDLLLGGPGESAASLVETIEHARSVGADRIGLSIGIRLYPRTPLARVIFGPDPVPSHHWKMAETQQSLLRPFFYIEPVLVDSIHELVGELVGEDPRFFFMDPRRVDANYNYNDNSTLVHAIRKGYRGAFWDILRRSSENLPPE